MKLIRIDPNGSVALCNGDSKSIREAVGGHIELVGMGDKHCGYLHEEGKLIGLPVNEIATRVWCLLNSIPFEETPDILVGPVVIFGTLDENGEPDGDEHSPGRVVLDAIAVAKKEADAFHDIFQPPLEWN